MNDNNETTHNLNESADKIRLSVKVKRGTGTRDQDATTIKARGETPEEAATNLDETVRALEDRDAFERIREIQPEVGDE
jgi:hypothetical protein